MLSVLSQKCYVLSTCKQNKCGLRSKIKENLDYYLRTSGKYHCRGIFINMHEKYIVICFVIHISDTVAKLYLQNRLRLNDKPYTLH